MTVEDIFLTLGILESYLSITIIPILSIILIIKAVKQKKRTGEWSYIRLLIIGAFLSFCWLLFWEFLFDRTNIKELIPIEIFGQHSSNFSIYNFGLLLIVTFGLTLITYANGWRSMYFTPFFVLIGMFIFFLITGFGEWLLPYIYTSAILSLIFLYITAFRIKDNGSLGLAIMFSLVLSTIIVPDLVRSFIPQIGLYLNYAYHFFGIFLATGYFNPLKKVGGGQE